MPFLAALAIVLIIFVPKPAKTELFSPISDASPNLSYYIARSQEFLDQAGSLASAVSQNKQTPEEKKQIIAVINQALDSVNQGIALYPQDSQGFSQRARIYETLIPFLPSSAKFAVDDLKTALSLENNNFSYYQRLSQLYLSLGDYQNAVLCLENALSINPQDAQTSYSLALLKEHQPASPSLVEETVGTQELPLKQAAAQNQIIIAQDLPAGSQPETNAQVDLNATRGQGVIPAGQTEVTIFNQNVADQKLILIVPSSDTQNKVVYLKAKQAPSARQPAGWFKVGIDSAAEFEVKFNWYILD